MRTLTTLSDQYYLDKGIAMFESVKRLMEGFNLYYLCLDRFTFDTLSGIDARLIPMFIDYEFRDNKDFELLAKNNKSNPNDHSDFHFALGSFFTNYIMEKKSPESILYIDADILFYKSLEVIFEAMEGNSIGLILHRHNKIGAKVGGYNVGVIYFRNNDVGRKCLKWWRDVVLDKNNKWYETHGMCGDQKYLELFEPLFGKENIKILDEDIIGHGAPWNFTLYNYFNDKSIIKWKEIIQILVFNHFSHFNYNENSYKIERENEWDGWELLKNPMIKRYYDEYFEILKDVKKRYKL